MLRCSLVSPTKSCVFFNRDSSVQPAKKLDFDFDSVDVFDVEEIKSESPRGNFAAVGQILWTDSSHTVNTKFGPKVVRDATFVDSKENGIPIAIWGEDIINSVKHGKTYLFKKIAYTFFKGTYKLQTTFEAKVEEAKKQFKLDWESVGNLNISRICCPEIMFTKLSKYRKNVECRNLFCKKKINPTDAAVTKCENCFSLMKTAKCLQVYTIEATIQHKGNNLLLTFFPNILEQFFGKDDAESMEQLLVTLDQTDIEFNKRQRIVTNMIKHEPL